MQREREITFGFAIKREREKRELVPQIQNTHLSQLDIFSEVILETVGSSLEVEFMPIRGSKRVCQQQNVSTRTYLKYRKRDTFSLMVYDVKTHLCICVYLTD